MTTATAPTTAAELAKRWAELKAEHPHLRARDAAQRLGVSEAQLLATQVGGGGVTRLEVADWPTFLLEFKRLGHVMCLTRNAGCVLEHKGTFEEIEIHRGAHGDMATVIGPIELRVFFKLWQFGFAVVTPGQHGKLQHSFQVFDKAGDAIVKVFVQPDGDLAAYEAITASYRAEHQHAEVVTEAIAPLATNPIETLDREALLADWAAMQDTHDFFGMLRRHKADREDAMRLAEGRFTRRVPVEVLQQVLETVSQAPRLPIMIFAGNKGNIQIHQAEVGHIKLMAPWLNVLDPGFNMHLNLDYAARVYAVHKPTADGPVTSLEVFDAQGEFIVQFFGLRKPGIAELADWRALVEGLPTLTEGA